MLELHASVNGFRVMLRGTERKLREFICLNNVNEWALFKIYHKGKQFCNTTDKDFLVDHNSTYWRMRELKEQASKTPGAIIIHFCGKASVYHPLGKGAYPYDCVQKDKFPDAMIYLDPMVNAWTSEIELVHLYDNVYILPF